MFNLAVGWLISNVSLSVSRHDYINIYIIYYHNYISTFFQSLFSGFFLDKSEKSKIHESFTRFITCRNFKEVGIGIHPHIDSRFHNRKQQSEYCFVIKSSY